MGRLAVVVLAGVAGVLVLHRSTDADRPGPERAAPVVSSAQDGVPTPGMRFRPPTTAQGGDEVEAVARQWVTAMWTRRPGEGPLTWLDRVAEITAPDFDTALRSARPWLADDEVLASSAEVTGVYPDARDLAALTVTCTVHLQTAAGDRNEPCVTTVTVERTGDGRLVVVAVR